VTEDVAQVCFRNILRRMVRKLFGLNWLS